jgi:hypothetical protein
MAKSFLTSIQLNGNSLLNGRIDSRWADTPSGTTNPDGTGTAVSGQLSSFNGSLYVYSGTAWTALSTGAGTVTSVTGTSPIVSSGGATPAISLASGYGDTQNPYASKTANFVLAAPNGSNGAPTFRALVSADIPTLDQNTTGSAATLTTSRNINGVAFDGSADITVTAAAGTLSGSTLNSGVTASSLTSVGTLTGLTVSGNIVMADNKITGLGTPTADGDAANKKYVDDQVAGLTWKDSVNLLASSNVALTGDTETLVIDGHGALDNGDDGYRILLTNQTTTADKGIYVYADNGSTYTLTRTDDANTFEELRGATVFVLEGTTYGKTSWVQSNHYITSFAGQSWVQFNGAQTYNAGAGLALDGNTFNVGGTSDRITVNSDTVDIAATYVGQSSITTLGTITTGVWNGTDIAIADGGTGASTAAAARSNLGATTKVTGAGSGSGTSIAVAHGLGTAVIAQLLDNTGAVVEVDVVTTATASGTTTFTFAATQTLSNFTYVIIG